jgi:hypothetical protein
MNQEEFRKFFKYISSVTTDTNPSPERTQVYFDTLNDLPFDVAMIAARKVIATLENPFLPMPAVFRGMALQVTGQTVQAAPDAYADVLKAIRHFGSYRETEALESLPPLTRKAAEAIGWKGLCLSEEPDVIRGQFRMAYEALEKREVVDARTPQKLKDVIAAMGGTPVRMIAEQPMRIIAEQEFEMENEELDALTDITERSNYIRELLAKAAKHRPKQITKTNPEELEKLYL